MATSGFEKKVEFSDNYLTIIKQMDIILEKKYDIATITLSGSLTAEQLSQLSEKTQSLEIAWKSSINFEDYKSHHTQSARPTDEKMSDYQLEKQFEERKADGCLWNLNIVNTDDTTEIVDFIVQQLRSKRIWSLSLYQYFSEKSFERIIHACGHSSVGDIKFGCKEQIVTDEQGKILAECLSYQKLEYIVDLSGKAFTSDTIEKFVTVINKKERFIKISDSPYFDERQDIEWEIERGNTQPTFGLQDLPFKTDDIERLTEKFTNSRYPIKFILNGTYTNTQWANFFSQVLSSKTPVTELSLKSETVMSQEVMLAIVKGLAVNTTIVKLTIPHQHLSQTVINALQETFKLNKTLTSVELRIINSTDLTTIVNALTSHPRLASLMLNYSNCSNAGKAFEELLTHTTALKQLYLVETLSNDNTISGIAMGLEKNHTLKGLYLTGNQFTDASLIQLGDALSKNNCLTDITFYTRDDDYTLNGVEHFVTRLQLNKSIVDIGLSYQTQDEKKAGPIQNLLHETLQRNETLAYHRQFEYDMEHLQPYVEIAIVLFQAHRQKLRWNTLVIVEKILAFLAPPISVAHPDQTRRCTDLIRSNLFRHEWKTSVMGEINRGWYKEPHLFTIFKKWPGPLIKAKKREEPGIRLTI